MDKTKIIVVEDNIVYCELMKIFFTQNSTTGRNMQIN